MFDLIAMLGQYVCFFILHVCGGGSFPKPLSEKQEREYLRKMHEGDIGARNKLVEHNLRLVAHIIKKYYGVQTEQDDLVSIGTIGLIKAIDTFKPDKNIRLSSYASRCIENEILMHFRSAKKTAQDVSLNETIDTDKDGNPLTLMDIMAVDDNILDELDRKLNG
ncbi:MAG: sigma-70 family RNA polymerase sigma factor, partial [Ruminococcus sp.]|nr:sigma-70 family RNA polymerase sigma factor [Ruminococcus sp.]